jgi:CRP-like cAMP-binding protein
MDYSFIAKTELFSGVSVDETKQMLSCLQVYGRQFKKNEYIYRTGEYIQAFGLILKGSVNVEQVDIWGNRSILSRFVSGHVFGEAYACVEQEPLLVDVLSMEDTEVLFLKIDRVLKTCPSSCIFHTKLLRNLLTVMAAKNLMQTRKNSYITKKTIRDRLLSYLSDQVVTQGQYEFKIPFNRQQLSEYLSVDRSALSNEISKLSKAGILSCDKNCFRLEKEYLEKQL